MRLSLVNNIDILRDKLFRAMAGESHQRESLPQNKIIPNRNSFLISLAMAKAKVNRMDRDREKANKIYFVRRNTKNNWMKRISPLELGQSRIWSTKYHE